MIVTAIQLFNWFPKKFYGTILSFCLLCSPLAFMLQFVIGGFYHCFPDMPYFYLNTATTYPISQSETENVPLNWCGYEYSSNNNTIITGTRIEGGGKFFYNTGFEQVT